ncbi:MAG: hypothetical protein ABIO70_29215 [Pseudomonadota bacterium]
MRALVPLLLLTACRPPPEAPEDLYELGAYLYAHAWDEDQEALVVGLEQLTTWLEAHEEEAYEGYEVGALSEEAVDALDEKDRTTLDMVGLSLTRLSQHPIADSTWALVTVDQSEIYPDTFAEYDREYLSGPACFVDMSCDRMEAMEELHSTFPLNLETWSTAHNQYVWVELEGGWAMVHRNWQVEPPEVSSDLMKVDEQAYLNLFVPGSAGAWRLQAQWTVYSDDNNTPRDFAEGLVLGFLEDCHDLLEAWLDENGVP